MLKNIKNLVIVFLVLMLSLVEGCADSVELPVRIGINKWAGYELLNVAGDLELYGDAHIKIVQLPNATTVMQALSSGVLEGAALTLDEVLTLIDRGIDLKLIAILDKSVGGDGLITDEKITSISELKGKQIAVENTAVGAIMLHQAIESAGLSMQDVVVKPCPVDRHDICFQQADALVTFEPLKTKLLQAGARQLFDSSQMEVPIIDVLAVKSEVIKSSPKTLQKLVDGYFRAYELKNNGSEDVKRIIMRSLSINEEEYGIIYDGLHIPNRNETRQYFINESGLLKYIKYYSDYLNDKSLINSSVNASNIIAGQYL